MKTIKLVISPSQYLKYWLFTIFVSSFVMTNSVKGTTPAFTFAAFSIPFLFFFKRKVYSTFLKKLIQFFSIYIVMQFVSQFLVLSSNIPDFSNLVLISTDGRAYFRFSLFTQSLYLMCGLITFLFTANFYNGKVHDRFISYSVLLIIFYGIYLWIFYILFNENGDFISNREYSDGLINPSQFQTMSIGGFSISRFVSLTMEPSMYVFTMLPFFIFLISTKYKQTAYLILVSLLLTFSGTFVSGIIVYLICLIIFTGSKRLISYCFIGIFLLSITFLSNDLFKSIINDVLIDKLLQQSDSGLDRFQSFFKHTLYYFNLPILVMFFGMGFGFIRSPEMFSTLLVNTGLIGFLSFFSLILYPVFKLPNSSPKYIGIKCSLIVISFMLTTSVSEYSYPSIWLIVGISYNILKAYNVENSLQNESST